MCHYCMVSCGPHEKFQVDTFTMITHSGGTFLPLPMGGAGMRVGELSPHFQLLHQLGYVPGANGTIPVEVGLGVPVFQFLQLLPTSLIINRNKKLK